VKRKMLNEVESILASSAEACKGLDCVMASMEAKDVYNFAHGIVSLMSKSLSRAYEIISNYETI